MSAPKTNIDTQVKRHKGPLWGMAFAMAVALVAFLAMVSWLVEEGDTPEGAEVQIDGRFGTQASD